ncbi:hemin uptake protein HemP [uncultured Roseobacter sp.]|uniref:hemin uptake protein HemP n=1 Tax=uncultured Roseobacter sp. TaxID=114847 RepID=UPI00262CA720|nr:hemin uptake protein HemP [uncultured Roseobacter sp.]
MGLLQTPPNAARAAAEIDKLPAYDARDLIPEGTQARLVLDGTVYTLRITRAGKLILTK